MNFLGARLLKKRVLELQNKSPKPPTEVVGTGLGDIGFSGGLPAEPKCALQVCVCSYLGMSVCLYVYMYLFNYVSSIHACLCVCVCMSVCVYVSSMHTCMEICRYVFMPVLRMYMLS